MKAGSVGCGFVSRTERSSPPGNAVKEPGALRFQPQGKAPANLDIPFGLA